MSLETTYTSYILENILLDSLYNGIILTSEDLENRLEEYKIIHKDLSLPRSKYLDGIISRGEYSSSLFNNNILDIFISDFIVLTKSLYNTADFNLKNYDRINNELNFLLSKSKKLESKINSILLLTNYTSGYFPFVEDIFTDLSLVDTNNTTAFIDIDTQSCSIASGSKATKSISQIDLNILNDSNIIFSIISKRDAATLSTISGKLENVFKTESLVWSGSVIANKDGKMITELNIILDKEYDISKVQLFSNFNSFNSNNIISLQYSLDGYIWNNVSSIDFVQSESTCNTWIFNKIKTKYIKFIVVKYSFDSISTKEYLYSYKSIKIFNSEYYEDNGNEFYSVSLSATKEGDIQSFHSASLDVCEFVPKNTSINYYLSASINNTQWTDWYQIAPSSTTANIPKTISFSNLSYKDNLANKVIIDSNNSSVSLVESITNNLIRSKQLSNNIKLINNAISINIDSDINLVSNSLILWRNLYTIDSSFVRNMAKGWSFNGEEYSCYFEIIDANGRFIDLGQSTASIDGVNYTGNILIPKGIHKFTTNSSNWYYIDPSISITSEQELKELDPLYPHNHKLLINGANYSSLYNYNKVYVGMDLSAEFYCIKTSLFDLEYNKNSYNYFSVKDISSNSNYLMLGIFVKVDDTNLDFQNEKFYIKWQNNTETSNFKYIKIKAIFNTSVPNITPKLSSYRIKLGS